MKKFGVVLLVFAFCFLGPLKGHSQVLISILFGEKLNSGKMEFGLVGGINSSTLIGMEDPKALNTFGLGMFLDYKFSNRWILGVEVNLKSKLGARNITSQDAAFALPDGLLLSSNRTERTLSVIHVPIKMNYRLSSGFGIGAGVYASIIHGSRDYIYYSENNADITYQQSFTDQLKPLDFGLTAGLHYHFNGKPGMQIRLQANYGLVDVFKDSSQLSGKNFWISAGVAVPILIKI